MGFVVSSKFPAAVAAVTDLPNLKDKQNSLAQTTLGTTLSDGTGTTVVLTSGHGAQFPTDNFFITVEDEIMYCSTRSTDTLTVARAQCGTSGVAHTSGVQVNLFIVAQLLNQMSAEINAIETYLGAQGGIEIGRVIALSQIGNLN